MTVGNGSTICAVSTAPGIGGIAVVRVSGPKAIDICNKVFRARTGGDLTSMKPYTIRYGQMVDGDTVVDEVLLSLFKGPHSFTGEDVIEISCHGSIYIQQEILKILIKNGCTMATAGEFTQRAFLNGKMDLSQAEAVADLIASRSRSAHHLALNQMRGGISNELVQLRDKLLHFTSLVELELDFSDHEDLEFADRTELFSLAATIEKKIGSLADSFSTGNAIKNGIPVAIVGETNAGKSTLLNALVGEERAIVSDIHGTTRDTLEDMLNLSGTLFRVIDTAGIRETSDTIESMGIERSYQAIAKAEIVVWVINGARSHASLKWLKENIVARAEGKHLLLVFNKMDCMEADEKEALVAEFADVDAPSLFISAKRGEGIEELSQMLVEAAQLPEIGANDVTITNLRHYEALCSARTAIQRVIEGLNAHLSGDLLSQDIRECLHYLGEITGSITTDEILGNIFSKFCIGK